MTQSEKGSRLKGSPERDRDETFERGIWRRRWILNTALFALIWLLLSDGAPGSWLIGIVVVPLAAGCAVALARQYSPVDTPAPPLPDLRQLPGFMVFFLTQSVLGGWNSAKFALHPRRPTRPGFVRHSLSLPPGRVRLFFINSVSVLPGTVSVLCEADELLVHVLDTHADNPAALAECEARVARLFGLGQSGPGPVQAATDRPAERAEGRLAQAATDGHSENTQ